MKKVALVFVVAVLLPSLVLAWLAVRSLRDQQFLLERQQSLLCQRVTDTLAQNVSDYLAGQQQAFGAQVESLAAGQDAQALAARFDTELRQRWPLADVGFCVTLSGRILSPSPGASVETRTFYTDNSDFLGNRRAVEVYGNDAFAKNTAQDRIAQNGSLNFDRSGAFQSSSASAGLPGGGSDQPQSNRQEKQARETPNRETLALSQAPEPQVAASALPPPSTLSGVAAKPSGSGAVDRLALTGSASQARQKLDDARPASGQFNAPVQAPVQAFNYKAAQARKVVPQSSIYQAENAQALAEDGQNNLSKVVPAEAEFGQLIGSGADGMLARFLQNKLRLMFWHRLSTEPDLIFGAQLNLDRVVDGLRGLVQANPDLRDEICVAILDDNAKPTVISRDGFKAVWKRPFVATEIGEALPHWEVAAYLINPAQLTRAAHTARLTLGLLVAVLMLAIGVGSWLIVSSLNAELKLARQKTDFVGNVSHELKTPLTSIRMFSELLAEGRVSDLAKQRSYLDIITAEAARLTRLINNVLDFSRMERGEKKYHFSPCDLVEVVRGVAQTFRPHLEAGGFRFDCALPEAAITLRGDADALSQVIVNLLSNAEKYSNGPAPGPALPPGDGKTGAKGTETAEGGRKDISLVLSRCESPLPYAEVRVLDRGPGVPRGSEEKIFEKFYRAHDSLSSGVQGSGLGLTIARQIARAHGGDVRYEPRPGGGSCFILRLPLREGSVEADVRRL